MDKFLSKITPEWALRAGLGAMYIYSGIDIVRHPTAWYWAVRPLFKWFPASMRASLSQPEIMNRYLLLQGIIEFILAFILLAWFLPKFWARWAAFITTLEFAAILLLVPIDAITFRDIGLLGGASALWIILSQSVFTIPTEKYETKSLKRVEHHLGKTPLTALGQADEPTVETFEEFMGTQSKE